MTSRSEEIRNGRLAAIEKAQADMRAAARRDRAWTRSMVWLLIVLVLIVVAVWLF